MEHLSKIDLYYASPQNIMGSIITLDEEESRHLVTVMRAQIGYEVQVTDGVGSLFKTKITSIQKSKVVLEIVDKKFYERKFAKIYFCIPHLKKQDRLAYLIEKVIELGVTNLLIFDSSNTLKRPPKIERNEKLSLSAMKQSLSLYKPKISYLNLNQVMELEGEKIAFSQDADRSFLNYEFEKGKKTNKYFLIGPEGDFASEELQMFGENIFYLTKTRLRSDTAALSAASIIFARLTSLENASTSE